MSSRALRSEGTKFRTLPSTPWLLLAVVVVSVALSVAVTISMSPAWCDPAASCVEDLPRRTLMGVWVGQAVVAVLGVLTVTNEYDTRMIATTLAASPHRVTVAGAKVAVLTASVLIAAALAVAGMLASGRIVLPGRGYTAEAGFAELSLADGPTLRAAIGTVLYLVLVSLLALGVGLIVRDTAAAVTVVLALLYAVPALLALVSNPAVALWLQRIAPSTAGMAVQDTLGLDDLPIRPWAGLGILAAWAVGAALLGSLLFHRRDA